MTEMASSLSVPAVIRGYHVYKEIWDAEFNEELACEREVGNRRDTFIVYSYEKGLRNSGPCALSHFAYLLNIYTTKWDNQVQGYWN